MFQAFHTHLISPLTDLLETQTSQVLVHLDGTNVSPRFRTSSMLCLSCLFLYFFFASLLTDTILIHWIPGRPRPSGIYIHTYIFTHPIVSSTVRLVFYFQVDP
ncbi:hypothetical protein BDN72DRAFT_46421 [Pluteus cervinus]|uniref:Uncharacterized protein n=1 Tax=Pluteus cervinus TaxID=181527 RepID=A0ACD3BIM2_9AGAR|nr:hypothetical protein BDN72DRAFT_46421 [Pluteus cervinus]